MVTTAATDNLAPQPNIYPDQDGPIFRNKADGSLELARARWGFPPIPNEKQTITNIRNLKSKWWSQVNHEWLTDPAYRCLVLFTRICRASRELENGFGTGSWRQLTSPASGGPGMANVSAEVPGAKRRGRVEERDWDALFIPDDRSERHRAPGARESHASDLG